VTVLAHPMGIIQNDGKYVCDKIMYSGGGLNCIGFPARVMAKCMSALPIPGFTDSVGSRGDVHAWKRSNVCTWIRTCTHACARVGVQERMLSENVHTCEHAHARARVHNTNAATNHHNHRHHHNEKDVQTKLQMNRQHEQAEHHLNIEHTVKLHPTHDALCTRFLWRFFLKKHTRNTYCRSWRDLTTRFPCTHTCTHITSFASTQSQTYAQTTM